MICVDSLYVHPDNVTVKVGDWYYGIFAEVLPLNATCRNVTWSSSDTSVVTVNPSTGSIFGKAAGTARIFATATDGSEERDYCSVTVSDTVKVEPSPTSLFNLMSPLDLSTAWRTKDKPKPVPPTSRLRALSTR